MTGAIPILSRSASAHFPNELDIDVQPGNEENFVDLEDHKSIEVLVSPSEFVNSDGEIERFDPVERDVRYRFGSWTALDDGEGARPTGEVETVETTEGHASEETVESLLLTFPVAEAGLEGGEEAAWLYWERDDSGEHGYAGVDKLRVYGRDASNRDLVQLLVDAFGDRGAAE